MRFQLPFSDVTQIITINSPNVSLPDNITVLAGGSGRDQREEAVRILHNYHGINAVVLIEPKRMETSSAVGYLHTISNNRRIRFSLDSKSAAGNGLSLFFSEYVHRREQEIFSAVCDNSAGGALKAFQASVSDCNIVHSGHLLRSAMTYAPQYGHKSNTFINAHIDDDEIVEIRIAECAEGTGTVLCDDTDFTIEKQIKDGMVAYHPKLVNSGISCWVLMSGSSVVMREPPKKVEYQDTSPCIHAHGLADPCNQPKRLTFRHDLVFC